jgi:hypothetical protein
MAAMSAELVDCLIKLESLKKAGLFTNEDLQQRKDRVLDGWVSGKLTIAETPASLLTEREREMMKNPVSCSAHNKKRNLDHVMVIGVDEDGVTKHECVATTRCMLSNFMINWTCECGVQNVSPTAECSSCGKVQPDQIYTRVPLRRPFPEEASWMPEKVSCAVHGKLRFSNQMNKREEGWICREDSRCK